VWNLCVGLLFTLEYEDAVGDVHWLKVHKVTDWLVVLLSVASRWYCRLMIPEDIFTCIFSDTLSIWTNGVRKKEGCKIFGWIALWYTTHYFDHFPRLPPNLAQTREPMSWWIKSKPNFEIFPFRARFPKKPQNKYSFGYRHCSRQILSLSC